MPVHLGWDYICNCLLDEWEMSPVFVLQMQWDLFP